MKLLLCLCLFFGFKYVLSQLNCYRCPISSLLTNEYFRKQNCSFLQDRRSYICCVQITTSFSCKLRRKRSDNPNFKFFLQSYPPPSSSYHFPANPQNEEHNSFLQNQYGNFPQQNVPHFLQKQPFGQINNQQNNNYLNNLAQSLPFAQQSNPIFEPVGKFNNFFNQINENRNIRNFSLLNQILPSSNFNFWTTKSPTTKVDAEESSKSEYNHVFTEKPSGMEDFQQIPIKRSVNKSEDMPLSDIYKHKNIDLLPLNKTCGLQGNADRIFGGEEALIGEFPWMSLLEYSFNGSNIGFKCGGILINDRYVLTAAHCIVGRTITPHENLIRVRLGEHDINTEIDCDDNDCNDLPLNVEVEEVILHHGYHEMDRNIHNDIALIRLNRKILYTDFVKPICLPLHGERTNPGQDMIIVGWGTKKEDLPSHVKQRATISYTNDTECKELWKNVVEIIDSQFCAGGKSTTNVCRGDSGGPIMSTSPENGHWYVEGIVSFGKIPCRREPFPSVYTRVSTYVTWILDNIKA